MEKYKNKDGIELNYTGNDSQSKLTREVIEEAIKILGEYNRSDLRSAEWALHRGINFLKENFDIEDRSSKWSWEDSEEDYPYNVEFGNGRTKEEMEELDKQCRIRAFNRNRSVENQVSTIEEIEEEVRKRIDEISNS